MNDYDRYGELAGDGFGAGPAQSTLGGFEERLLAALTREVAGRAAAPAAARGPRRRRAAAGAATGPRRWRPALLGATAVAAAGAAAVALVAANGAPAAGPGPAATATGVLRSAALAALQTPAEPPKPGQFIYSKVIQQEVTGTATEQKWISADGTRTGLEKWSGPEGTLPIQACVSGFVEPPAVTTPPTPDERTIPCDPGEFAAYNPAIPTTPAALRRYLNGQRQGRVAIARAAGVNHHLARVENTLWDDPALIRDMMTSYFLSPQQRAAMYRLLAHTPGLKLLPRVMDLQGTAGIGIGVPWKPGTLSILIFSPGTYALLGGATAGSNGKPAQQWLLAQIAVVNKAGRAP